MQIGQVCLSETSCPLRTVHCRSLECGPVNIALTAQPWFSCRERAGYPPIPSTSTSVLNCTQWEQKWSQTTPPFESFYDPPLSSTSDAIFGPHGERSHFTLDNFFQKTGAMLVPFFSQHVWKVYQCFLRKAVYHKRSQLQWDKLLKFPLSSLRETLSVLL